MGPPPNNCEQVLDATLMGKPEEITSFHLILDSGLSFDSEGSPTAVINQLLRKSGYASAEDLRRELLLPKERLLCLERPSSEKEEGLVIKDAKTIPEKWVSEVLFRAVVLGLCSGCIYDPNRCVVWTDRKLRRIVALCKLSDFYAN